MKQQIVRGRGYCFTKDLINLPASRLDMDQLITVYFQEWGNALPILDKNAF